VECNHIWLDIREITTYTIARQQWYLNQIGRLRSGSCPARWTRRLRRLKARVCSGVSGSFRGRAMLLRRPKQPRNEGLCFPYAHRSEHLTPNYQACRAEKSFTVPFVYTSDFSTSRCYSM